MRIESVIDGAHQVVRHGATEKNTVHLVVDGVRQGTREIGSQLLDLLHISIFTHPSKVSRIKVLGVLKFGFWSKGTSQYCTH